MKVLKKGRKKCGWSKKLECTGVGNGDLGCGAILLVEGPDLFKTSSTDMKAEKTYYFTFKCPQCGTLSDLPYDEKLPMPLLKNVPNNQIEWEKGKSKAKYKQPPPAERK